MAPIINCVRHGQGFHNVGSGCYTLPDPRLTPLGEEQSANLRTTSFPDQSKISLIFASPLCRTLHTASIVFQQALSAGAKCHPQIIALPDAQETSDDPCDIGSAPSILRQVVAENNWPVDLSLVKDGWNVKTLGSRYSPESKAIAARARDARVFIRQKIRELVENGDAEPQVVLVTHGGFLHYFTEDWEDAWRNPGTGWQNCETRSYEFAEGVGSEKEVDEVAEVGVRETLESRRGRGKMGPMLGREKQLGLFELTMESWERQGLQRPDRIGIEIEKRGL